MFVSLLLFEARFNGVREEEQAVQSDTISTVGEAKWFPSVLTVGRAGTAVFLHLDPCGGFHSQFFISHELRRRQAITASRRCALCRTTRAENKLKQQPASLCGGAPSSAHAEVGTLRLAEGGEGVSGVGGGSVCVPPWRGLVCPKQLFSAGC